MVGGFAHAPSSSCASFWTSYPSFFCASWRPGCPAPRVSAARRAPRPALPRRHLVAGADPRLELIRSRPSSPSRRCARARPRRRAPPRRGARPCGRGSQRPGTTLSPPLAGLSTAIIERAVGLERTREAAAILSQVRGARRRLRRLSAPGWPAAEPAAEQHRAARLQRVGTL